MVLLLQNGGCPLLLFLKKIFSDPAGTAPQKLQFGFYAKRDCRFLLFFLCGSKKKKRLIFFKLCPKRIVRFYTQGW